MTSYEKVMELKSIIMEQLIPIINQDYYLLEVPYYTNIGDTLIWQGEMDFLNSLPYQCKGMYSLDTFNYPQISKDILILFQGGGNFGDLWPKHHNFKLSVIKHYPDNQFVFLPQTVYFESDENMRECAMFLSQFKNVTICARDSVSYELLKNNFSNKILLLPDMAFCINMEKWGKKTKSQNSLLLKRMDKELKESTLLSKISQIKNIKITDWPTMMSMDYPTLNLERIKYRLKRFPCILDMYCRYYYRPHLIKTGVKIIMEYSKIYSTRLHAAILAVLLNKSEIYFLDNSYGKNKSFYDTWLSDCDQIHFLS